MTKTRKLGERRVWTLVANPGLYDIEGAISGLAGDWWDRHASDLQPGDGIVIWRTKADGDPRRGVLALGEVVGQPETRSDSENPFHRDQASAAKVASRVPVRYIPIQAPLWIGGEHDELILSLSASRGRQTVFIVTPDQWAGLAKVLPIPKHLMLDLADVIGPHRNPPWSRDELILALDLYVRHEGNPPSKGSPEIHALSSLLNRIGRGLGGNADFRNANGVYMKAMNFRRFDPAFIALGQVGLQRGNRDEAVVWETYAYDPSRLRETAEAIQANAEAAEAISPVVGDGLPEGLQEAEEGRVLTVTHSRRERSQKLVDAKKAAVVDAGGRLACEACEFDYETTYGVRGRGYIEVHHVRPLSSLRPSAKTQLSDLALVCANCHRMIHANAKWLTMGQLLSILGR